MQNSTLQLHTVLQPDRRPAELGTLVYRKNVFCCSVFRQRENHSYRDGEAGRDRPGDRAMH